MTVVEIGKTEEGRPELTAIITSPENHKKLAQFKETNRKLALADGITDEQARQLARDGKTVVWIDGGLHATEVLGAQQLIETIYRLNSKIRSRDDADPERRHHPLTLINPDGMELVSNWYMREPDEKKRSTGGIPRLYQKYIGHDDNRDFYMAINIERGRKQREEVRRRRRRHARLRYPLERGGSPKTKRDGECDRNAREDDPARGGERCFERQHREPGRRERRDAAACPGDERNQRTEQRGRDQVRPLKDSRFGTGTRR